MKIVKRGEEVYQCNVCGRKVRVAQNIHSVSVLPYCNITAECKGKLTKVTKIDDIVSTPAITPQVEGLTDWSQRQILFNYSQFIPNAKWTIKHNMNNAPTYDVLVYRRDVLIPYTPEVKIIDKFTSELIFDKPYSGIAQAISLASGLKYSKLDYIPPQNEYIEVSNNTGLLTFAILDDLCKDTIKVQLLFKNRLNYDQILEYEVIANPNIYSPWSDSDLVFVGDKRYNVRTINVTTDIDNAQFFALGDIPDNAQFIFHKILFDGTVLSNLENRDDIIVLLSRPPFNVPDKIKDQLIYVNQTTFPYDFSKYYFALNNGQVIIDPSTAITIYPYIKTIK